MLETKESEVEEVLINLENPKIKVMLGTDLCQSLEKDLTNFMKDRKLRFYWKHADMASISTYTITHKLNDDPNFRPIHQKRRKDSPGRNLIIQKEVERLLKDKMIEEVKFLIWLANVVVVEKKNRKWRVCMDFMDLNKACLKVPFPFHI